MARVLDSTASSPFIGRVRELAQLRQALDRARAGTGSVVLVTGEPGIGKTRLVEEAVGGHTGPLAWGRCAAQDVAPAFRPWIDVLSRFTDRPVFPAPRSAADPDRFADGRPDRRAWADTSRSSSRSSSETTCTGPTRTPCTCSSSSRGLRALAAGDPVSALSAFTHRRTRDPVRRS